MSHWLLAVWAQEAFHGDYLLTVSYFGEVIQEQELTVVKGNNVFDVTIQ